MALVSLIASLFFNFIWGKVHWSIFCIGIVILIVQMTSYTYTALANPGIPKAAYEHIIMQDEGKNFRQCKDCKLWINTEENTLHCYECDICVEGKKLFLLIGYDHHCPWTTKCIGKGNVKAFYIFLCSTMMLFGFLIFAASIISN
jgi:hypothetical protein